MNHDSVVVGCFEYFRKDLIGHGAFAIVYKGHYRDDPSRLIAAKCISKKNLGKAQSLLQKEIAILKELSTLRHDNVVCLLDCIEQAQFVHLIMEYCNGGDLGEYLLKHTKLTEDTISLFFRQVASAICALHEHGIVHRDLKPQNLLLCYTCPDPPVSSIRIKIADFGFARVLESGKMAATLCGSPMYMAPEVIMSKAYDGRADLWSVGVIMYQCFTGRAPFRATSPMALKNLYERAVELAPVLPSSMSDDLRNLLTLTLERNVLWRVEFDQFRSHPFFNRYHLRDAYMRCEELVIDKDRNSSDSLAATNLKVFTESPEGELGPERDKPSTTNFSVGSRCSFKSAASFSELPPRICSEQGSGASRSNFADVVYANVDNQLPPKTFTNLAAETQAKASGFITASDIPMTTSTCQGTTADIVESHRSEDSCPQAQVDTGLDHDFVFVTVDNDQHHSIAPQQAKLPSPVSSQSVEPKRQCVGRDPNQTFSFRVAPKVRLSSGLSTHKISTWNDLKTLVASDNKLERSRITKTSKAALISKQSVSIRSCCNIEMRQSTQTSNYSSSPPIAFPLTETAIGNSVPVNSAYLDVPQSFEVPELSADTLCDAEHSELVSKIQLAVVVCSCIEELVRTNESVLRTISIHLETTSSSSAYTNEAIRVIERVVLNMKLLEITTSCFELIRRELRSGRMKPTKTVSTLISEIHLIFQNALRKATQLHDFLTGQSKCFHRSVLQSSLSVSCLLSELKRVADQRVSAYKLLFYYAVQKCLTAAMDESLGNPIESYKQYQLSRAVIHCLAEQTTNISDRNLLAKYQQAIESRACAIEKEHLLR